MSHRLHLPDDHGDCRVDVHSMVIDDFADVAEHYPSLVLGNFEEVLSSRAHLNRSRHWKNVNFAQLVELFHVTLFAVLKIIEDTDTLFWVLFIIPRDRVGLEFAVRR